MKQNPNLMERRQRRAKKETRRRSAGFQSE
jgi:hypothetical protein